eukprot:2187656-Prymnesium_polylepis.1
MSALGTRAADEARPRVFTSSFGSHVQTLCTDHEKVTLRSTLTADGAAHHKWGGRVIRWTG